MQGSDLGRAISGAFVGIIILAFVAGLIVCGLAVGAHHVIAWLIP